jgi:branched-chain amino acid transport system ATP-binding protein
MTAATPQGTADAPAARGGAGAAHGSTAQGSTAPETTSGSTAPGAAAAETVLEAERISLAFGGVRALTDVSFHVRKGELFSIIGPNGAGKTSMVNCISGRYSPTEGRILFKGQDITRL